MVANENDAIAKYELIRKLGEGSFGEVWLVHDPDIDEDVALKYLRLSEESEDYLDLFKREFQILSEIRHTHLANVFNFGYSPAKQQYFFTSEFCPGQEFLEAMTGKPFPYVEEALVQILSALDYVHSQGIVHFDIKSENILVSEDDGKPFIKILDFGIAAKLKALPQGVAGTPSYMAPEIVSKGASVDHRADLYSLGMLLLRSLTGKLPFDTNDADAVLNWHVKGRLPDAIWDGVELPRYMRELIEKLLEKKAVDRFSNARVVLHFLNASTGRKYLVAEQDLTGKIPREGPLVERDDLMREIRSRLQSFSSVCVISGPQGIGKSRIISETRHMIELEEISFLDVVCDWQIPAWPKIEEWLDISSTAPPETSEEWQVRMQVDALLEAAKKKPFCLLIDEFHKADRMLKIVLPALEEKLDRNRKEGTPSHIFILAATEESLKNSVPLKRLSAEGIGRYIGLVLGETERDTAVAALLHQYSGGLPLLMVEGLRFLAPHLYRDEPLENLLPPPQIGALYREKIDALSEDEHALLATLALLFRPTTGIELANILWLKESEIAGLASTCLREELLSATSGGEGQPLKYQVSSQALSLDIIRSLPPEQSAGLHHRIARGLAEISETPLNEIAYHTAKGGDVDTAISYYRKASSFFKKQRRVAAATDCLVKAINFCQPSAFVWHELLQEASQLLIVSGQYREAEDYMKKLEGTSTFEIEELRGLLALKKLHLEEARACYQRALAMLPDDDVLQRILIENSLGNVDIQDRKFDAAIATFRKTLDDERNLATEDRLRISNNSLGLALSLMGDIDGAVQFYRDQIKNCPTDRTAERISLESSMGYVLLQASHYEEAIPHFRTAVELSEKSGAMHALFSSMGNLISALLKEARYAETLSLIRKMSAYQERMGSRHDITYNLLREGSIYLSVGMEETARECFTRGRSLSQEIGERTLASWFLLMEGYLEREYGSVKKAKEQLELAKLEAGEMQDKDLVAWAHYSLADIAFDEGDHQQCRLQLEVITELPKDDEFRLRLELIRAKLSALDYEGNAEELFAPLETDCKKNKLQELLWEVYSAWAQAEIARGNRTKAIPLLMKGIRILETIASALPEEYRDRYLRQRSRKKLFAAFKELTGPAKAGEKPEPADVHAAKSGKKREGTVAEGSKKK